MLAYLCCAIACTLSSMRSSKSSSSSLLSSSCSRPYWLMVMLQETRPCSRCGRLRPVLKRKKTNIFDSGVWHIKWRVLTGPSLLERAHARPLGPTGTWAGRCNPRSSSPRPDLEAVSRWEDSENVKKRLLSSLPKFRIKTVNIVTMRSVANPFKKNFWICHPV